MQGETMLKKSIENLQNCLTCLLHFLAISYCARIAVFAFWIILLGCQLFAQSQREYIYLNGRLIAVETANTAGLTISNVQSSGISNTSATITWTTSETSNSQIEYGVTTGYGSSTALDSSMVTAHSMIITGLSAGTLYHYMVKSRNAAGTLVTAYDFTFTTLTNDTTPPVISGVVSSAITDVTATISWFTDEASDTQVEYGTTTGYGSSTVLDSLMIVIHAQVIRGLSPNTLYHYRVISKDAAGNIARSDDRTFTTAIADTTAPTITNVTSSGITSNQATISWTTNEFSDSQIEYGVTTSYGSSTPLDSSMVTSHSMVITGLTAGTVYHYKVKSKDAAGNVGSSPDNSFTTGSSSSLPTPWATSDIGSTGIAGSAGHTSLYNTFTVGGSGADIWSTADAFRYVYQQVSGDVTITARVVSMTNTNGWAKAGVMIRDGLGQSAAHAFTLATASNGIRFQRRVTAGDVSAFATTVSGAAPYWVRLKRAGNTFTSYVSTDGTNWTTVGSYDITMATAVYVGLAVTSHDNSLLCTATFDNVLVDAIFKPVWYGASSPLGSPMVAYRLFCVRDPYNYMDTATVYWQRIPGINEQQFGSGPRAGCSAFQDTNIERGKVYTYRLRNKFGAIFSEYTDPWSVKTRYTFDDDVKSDLTIYRPSMGVWQTLLSNNSSIVSKTWGLATDKPLLGDFNGDGTTDRAMWRSTNGGWYIMNSGTPETYTSYPWGLSEDIPVPGDYDHDGKTDIAVWRPSNGVWYILLSGTPGTYLATQWGLQSLGDIPVPADYDGDGIADIAVWRANEGIWFILKSSAPGTYSSTQWGLQSVGDIPVPADYDGDGKTDIAVYRSSTGIWYVLLSGTPGAYTSILWGMSGDVPVPADYDGDGKMDIAVWRPSTGTWYMRKADGTYTAYQFGMQGDVPLAAVP
jgi:regulation of enolase protein 1 (concanavalin A-like superfamily)